VAAEQRNRFVLEHAEQIWIPFAKPGGMLERLMREVDLEGKRI
jgi:hypothetical protein